MLQILGGDITPSVLQLRRPPHNISEACRHQGRFWEQLAVL